LKCIEDKNEEKIQSAKIFAENELGVIDGKATERVISQILQLKNQK